MADTFYGDDNKFDDHAGSTVRTSLHSERWMKMSLARFLVKPIWESNYFAVCFCVLGCPGANSVALVFMVQEIPINWTQSRDFETS